MYSLLHVWLNLNFGIYSCSLWTAVSNILFCFMYFTVFFKRINIFCLHPCACLESTHSKHTWKSCQACLIDPDCVSLGLLSLCLATLEKTVVFKGRSGSQGRCGMLRGLDPRPLTGLETPFLGSQTTGNKGIDRGQEAPLTLFESLLLFCSVLGHSINHALLTCLLTNGKVLSTNVSYGCGNSSR